MEGDNISTEHSSGSDLLPVMFRDRDLTWPSKEHDLERGLVLLEPRESV